MKKVNSVEKEKSIKTVCAKKAVTKAEPVKVVEAKQEELAEVAKAEPVAEKKTVAKKTVTKVSVAKDTEAIQEEIFVQVDNQEILTTDIINKVKAAFVAEGHAEDSIKKVRVYIKPEENMVYYVVNDDYASGVSLF